MSENQISETIRLVYNLILIGLVVVMTLVFRQETNDWYPLAGRCIVGAVIANMLYIAAPIAESYLQWLGLGSRAITPLLFATGLLASMMLAAVSVLSMVQPSKF